MWLQTRLFTFVLRRARVQCISGVNVDNLSSYLDSRSEEIILDESFYFTRGLDWVDHHVFSCS